MTDIITVRTTEANAEGYRTYKLGGFTFSRDEFFVYFSWPTGNHTMSVDIFLRAMQRDVAWDFFYGTVNFDAVIATVNHYGNVDMCAGRFNEAYRKAELDHVENFESPEIMATFKAILDDWTSAEFDPFASPSETGKPFGVKNGNNTAAVTRRRVAAARMVGVPGDEEVRTDATHPVNRMFADVPQDQPVIEAEPGFEDQVAAFNLLATSVVPTSRGTHRLFPNARRACTAQPVRNTFSPSFTATIVSSGSCKCPTTLFGTFKIAIPAPSGPLSP